MILTDLQNDDLKEIINIAFGKAAASLSSLTGQRVMLEVPVVSMLPIGELHAALAELVPGEVASVHQFFNGPVSGNAVLLMQQKAARLLTNLLIDEESTGETMNASAREAMVEVGNILLNACLGSFGNILNVHIIFSVPRLHLNELSDMLNSITFGKEELRYCLLIKTDFRLRESEVGGYLVFILGVASIDRLLQAIESMS